MTCPTFEPLTDHGLICFVCFRDLLEDCQCPPCPKCDQAGNPLCTINIQSAWKYTKNGITHQTYDATINRKAQCQRCQKKYIFTANSNRGINGIHFSRHDSLDNAIAYFVEMVNQNRIDTTDRYRL